MLQYNVDAHISTTHSFSTDSPAGTVLIAVDTCTAVVVRTEYMHIRYVGPFFFRASPRTKRDEEPVPSET